MTRRLADLSNGSSPRSRGTLRSGAVPIHIARFIPALAGNTRAGRQLHQYAAVHPRARGEHVNTCENITDGIGSSPRSRGTLDHRQAEADAGRFIPALAGNTSVCLETDSVSAVHPRARGEHKRIGIHSCRSIGSSPRSRGTHRDYSRACRSYRFIPALAGNTLIFGFPPTLAAVHPRARGEHIDILLRTLGNAGSSPRSRGTLGYSCLDHDADRFIPALAGNTSAAVPVPFFAAVHPRARGEHSSNVTVRYTYVGSSPRSRGTPLQNSWSRWS